MPPGQEVCTHPADPVELVPAGHAVHPAFPVPKEYVFAAHGLQTPAPAAE